MNIELKDLLALLGEKTVQIALLESQVAQLQARLQAHEAAKEAKVPVSVVESLKNCQG